jgi:hypothetical protein
VTSLTDDLLHLVDMSTWAEHQGLEESETEWPADRVLELGYLRAIACGVSAITLLLLRQDEPAYSRWRDLWCDGAPE